MSFDWIIISSFTVLM